MSDMNEWLIRLLPPVVIVGTILFNRLWLPQLWRQRGPGEAAAICEGLRTELLALRDLYEENLRLMAREQPPLLSTRMATSFYRTNLPRLTVLLERETLTGIVAAFTSNESIESYRTAIAHPRRSANYSRLNGPLIIATEEKFRSGLVQIKIALGALEHLGKPQTSAAIASAAETAPLPDVEWHPTPRSGA